MHFKRIIYGVVIFLIGSIQVASQHLPSRQAFNRDLLYDDNFGNSNLETNFAPYQAIQQKQKLITATGNNDKVPSKIAFDTYNMFGYPSLLKRLRQANKYWPIKDQNQLQQLQQATTNAKGKQSLQEQQSQLSAGFKPIKGNGNKFVDMMFPIDDTANDVPEDQNVNENSIPTLSSQELNEKQQSDDDAAGGVLDNYFLPESRRANELPEKRATGNKNKKLQFMPFEYDVDKWIQKTSNHPTTNERTSADDNLFLKRNAFRAFKRQKAKPEQTQFVPSISAGAMTNLGHFFTDLKNNVEFMENRPFNPGEKQLLEGDHPIVMLKEEIMRTIGNKPNGNFLNAIRTYQPSQKIRSLVAMNPRGYHGSQFLDPNYYYIGLG